MHMNKLLPVCLCVLLTACGSVTKQSTDSAPKNPPDVSQVPDAVPQAEPHSRYGNPASYEVFGQTYYTTTSSEGYVAEGTASWYGTKFHGNRTSSGEPYDMYEMTAAHTSLPLPTYARVTNLENGKTVVVKINDRGPFVDDRLIDLSYSAAHRIDMLANGTARVRVEAINPEQPTVMYASHEPTTIVPPPGPAAHTASNSDTWFLQLGAFGDAHSAQALVNQLDAQIQDPIFVDESAGDALYRVQVGPFSDEPSAQASSQHLAALTLEAPMLVTK